MHKNSGVDAYDFVPQFYHRLKWSILYSLPSLSPSRATFVSSIHIQELFALMAYDVMTTCTGECSLSLVLIHTPCIVYPDCIVPQVSFTDGLTSVPPATNFWEPHGALVELRDAYNQRKSHAFANANPNIT